MQKLLIIGHGRHGKDTVAEILQDYAGYKFTSSSRWVCEQFIWPNHGQFTKYDTIDGMYDERHAFRLAWYDAIKQYNTPDLTRTASEMLAEGYDIYVGMRRRAELEAVKAAGIFDHVVWVDRGLHLPSEPQESMELHFTDADFYIDNNSDMDSLHHETMMLHERIQHA